MSELWDRRFLELAEHIAQWSKDPSTKVGAVLVDDAKLVTGMGYNGFPRGVVDSEDRLLDRPTKYAMVVHAEVNAILMAGTRAKGCTLYVWWPTFPLPCNECTKVVIQAGIKEVVGIEPRAEFANRTPQWQTSVEISQTMCREAGVKYRTIPNWK